jgi:hypothetical protein
MVTYNNKSHNVSLLAHEDGSHTHSGANAHAGDEDFATGLLCNVVASRYLTGSS